MIVFIILFCNNLQKYSTYNGNHQIFKVQRAIIVSAMYF